MNVLIADSWLREYVETKATRSQIADALSLHGASVESITKKGDDYVYDIEITTNRIDMISIIGMAREVAASLKREGLKATFKPLNVKKQNEVSKKLEVEIQNDPKLCKRVLAVALSDVSTQESPKFIKDRLEASGVRSLNLLIDITNYVMLEVGHPSHVFDLDRIKEGKMIIRESKKGEQITSLEHKTYELPGGDTVIEDGKGTIIDLPGIIGTSNSVVVDNTKSILFFIENNDQVKMRKSSMQLDIHTLASSINEKGPDPELAYVALLRGLELYIKYAGATQISKIYDNYLDPTKTRQLALKHSDLERIAGIELKSPEVMEILQDLGFKTVEKTGEYNVTVPTWRLQDVTIKEDLIEEVVRMYGYHNVPSIIPPLREPSDQPDLARFYWERKIKQILSGQPEWHEVYTYSLIPETLVIDSSSALKIINPLTEDTAFLRTSLVPSLVEVIRKNKKYQDKLAVFEIANTYIAKDKDIPTQEPQLGIVSNAHTIIQLKETVEKLLQELGIEYELEQKSKINQKVMFNVDGTTIGTVYAEQELVVAEIELNLLKGHTRRYKSYRPVATYPVLVEDMTFTLSDDALLGPVIKEIYKQSVLIHSVELVGTYEQNATFRINYLSEEKSLTSGDIEPIRKKIDMVLETNYSAKLVAKLNTH